MQRPRLVQKLTAAAELRGWRREEDEEERHEGEKRNDPSVLFIRQKDMFRRDNQGATKRSCRLDFRRSIKQRSIMDSFGMTGDVTPVYSNQRR